MSILILAEDHDPTVDRVVAALREHGAELDGEAWSGTATIAESLLDADRA